MKNKNLFIALLLISTVSQVYASKNSSCDCNPFSRSYLAVKPYFLSASPERVAAFRDERANARENGKGIALQVVLFGARSTDPEALARYFSPNCSPCFIVNEELSESNITNELFAEHFNIYTVDGDFKSKVSFNPRQTTIGAGFEFRQGFWRNPDKQRGFFYDIATAIVRVKNNMELCEKVINDGGGADEEADDVVVANMTQAFRQSDWCFGKICGAQTKTGLSDIEFKVGYEWLQHRPYHLETYLGVIIPTGNTPKGIYLFEPIVGNGHHFGVTFGSGIGFQIWSEEEKDRHLRVEYNVHTEYLFNRKQKRGIDLQGKPWSRYMEVYIDQEQAQEAADLGGTLGMNLATPGINVFTRDVKVTPGIAHIHNTAFVLNWKSFQGEAGYNYFARSADCVKLACKFPTTIALKAEQGLGQQNPVRDITNNPLLNAAALAQPLADYAANVVQEDQLDLNSAAQPDMNTNALYVALGNRWDNWRYPFFINFGGSYEWTQNSNGALDRWVAWGKFGFSF